MGQRKTFGPRSRAYKVQISDRVSQEMHEGLFGGNICDAEDLPEYVGPLVDAFVYKAVKIQELLCEWAIQGGHNLRSVKQYGSAARR